MDFFLFYRVQISYTMDSIICHDDEELYNESLLKDFNIEIPVAPQLLEQLSNLLFSCNSDKQEALHQAMRNEQVDLVEILCTDPYLTF